MEAEVRTRANVNCCCEGVNEGTLGEGFGRGYQGQAGNLKSQRKPGVREYLLTACEVGHVRPQGGGPAIRRPLGFTFNEWVRCCQIL